MKGAARVVRLDHSLLPAARMQYRHAGRGLNLLLKRDTRAAPKGVIRAPDLDLLLGFDPNGFDESRCAFTLALHEARELGLSHSH